MLRGQRNGSALEQVRVSVRERVPRQPAERQTGDGQTRNRGYIQMGVIAGFFSTDYRTRMWMRKKDGLIGMEVLKCLKNPQEGK